MSVVDSLATHPIVEMMLSPQFQGSMRKKDGARVETVCSTTLGLSDGAKSLGRE
eukprot:gene28005-36885_t